MSNELVPNNPNSLDNKIKAAAYIAEFNKNFIADCKEFDKLVQKAKEVSTEATGKRVTKRVEITERFENKTVRMTVEEVEWN